MQGIKDLIQSLVLLDGKFIQSKVSNEINKDLLEYSKNNVPNSIYE